MGVGADSLDAAQRLLCPSAEGDEPRIALDRRSVSLVITPSGENTFPVTIYDEGEEAMVSAARWHSHYDDPVQAAFCAMWLLTPYYRVVHEMKGGVMVAAWLERYEESGWTPLDPVFFLNPDAPETWEAVGGEKFTRRYTQQAVLPSPRPYQEISPGAVLDDCGWPPDFTAGERVVDVDEPLGLHL
jgi:hypothetical protein